MMTLRALAAVAALFMAYLVYGWGANIVNTYNNNIARVTELERDNKRIESRVASLRTLIARRDAAIAASKCSAQIGRWLKNPDEIPTKFDPFNQLD